MAKNGTGERKGVRHGDAGSLHRGETSNSIPVELLERALDAGCVRKGSSALTGPFRATRCKCKEQARSPTELGGFHPSARAARGFLLEGVELVSIGREENRVPRAEERGRKGGDSHRFVPGGTMGVRGTGSVTNRTRRFSPQRTGGKGFPPRGSGVGEHWTQGRPCIKSLKVG